MSTFHIAGVIPARLNSTRLNRKVLRLIAGRPMVEWVWLAATGSGLMDFVVVATDSEDVAGVCRGRGIPAVFTPASCPSGSDRVREVARVIDAEIYVNIQGDEPPRPVSGSPLDRAVPPGVQPTAAFANRHDVLAADIPSQGTMTARAVARMYAALLGHIEGVELISARRLKSIAAPAFSGTDQVMGFPTTWALGYSPARLGTAQPRPGSTFGMVGSNGTAAYADIDSGIAVAVMRNRIVGDFSVVTAIDDIVAAHYG